MSNSSCKSEYVRGLKAGIPIALGYLPVSMACGIAVSKVGIPLLISQIMATVIYSGSGQAAAANLYGTGETSIIMYMLTLFVMNCRYMLFSMSLSQKLDPSMKMREKILVGSLNTDEIFGVVINEKGYINAKYFLGVATLPFISFFTGNILGSVASDILPKSLSAVMYFMLYAMFISIVVPNAKRSKPVLGVVMIALIISFVLECIPGLTAFLRLSSGWIIIICAIVSSLIGALIFPVSEEEKQEEEV